MTEDSTRLSALRASIIQAADSDNHSEPISDLIQMGLRVASVRPYLLVSTVLGKHIPAEPQAIHAAGTRLGQRVSRVLGDQHALVIGFAETATMLGQLVADQLGSPYIHSTRRGEAGVRAWCSFQESHSHAPAHTLDPWPFSFMHQGEVVVLVDDEITTAQTALNTIAELHGRVGIEKYVVASLVDVRGQQHQERAERFARELGIEIGWVSLSKATISLPTDFRAPNAQTGGVSPSRDKRGEVIHIDAPWPKGLRESARHGVGSVDPRFETAISAAAELISDALPVKGGRTHVLGTEEFMYSPLRIALKLAGNVTFSATTRSPAVVLDSPGYPIRSAISFEAHDLHSAGTRYAYNLMGSEFDQIVLVLDEDYAQATVEGLISQLARLAPHVVVVKLPTYRPPTPLRGPDFGTYRAEDVGWLVKDLSRLSLEVATDTRERRVQAGVNYAEMLPIEYQPDAEYLALFEGALERSATRVAQALELLGQQILDTRGPEVVIASLARAGTPIGILLRRWAAECHGLDWPHYTLSIVRDRGIDANALDYLATRHQSSDVQFVDGWTGKGAIARELKLALAAYNLQRHERFIDTLAVLADPGYCATLFGTRDDFLIPSACLNSTVSGLISRTVLNPHLIKVDDFHGAKFYSDLRDQDVSQRFLDRILHMLPGVHADSQPVSSSFVDAPPDWRGWTFSKSIADEFGIRNLNLVKPGVGETTRVLLRRVPWKVLIRPGAEDDVALVHHLASARGVEVVWRPELPFTCVGLIRPSKIEANA